MQAYLTDKDFEIAKSNGISYNTVYCRFYEYGWDLERAITEPVKKRSDCLWYKYKEQAEENRVGYHLFYYRTKVYGMTPEEAATEPVVPGGGNRRKVRFTPEIMKQAEANGIKKGTLKHRIYSYGWSLEKAVSTPVDKSKRRKDYEANRT